MIDRKISGTQFSVLVFLSSISFIASLPGDRIHRNVTDSVISTLLSCGIGLVLSLPIFFRGGGLREAKNRGWFSKLLSGAYLLYFFYLVIWDLAVFLTMLFNTIVPNLPLSAMLAALLAVCAYGASKGIEALGRSALLVLAAFLLGMILLAWGVIPMADRNNLRVFFYDGFSDTARNIIPIFARSNFLPQTVILLSGLNGRLGRKFLIWSILAGLLPAAILFTVQLCLGEYAATQEFPAYILSSAAVLIPAQRLDIIFNFLWSMTLVLRVSATMLAAYRCGSQLLRPGARPWFLPAFSLAAGVIVFILIDNMALQSLALSSWLAAALAAVLGSLVPLGLLIAERIPKRKIARNRPGSGLPEQEGIS